MIWANYSSSYSLLNQCYWAANFPSINNSPFQSSEVNILIPLPDFKNLPDSCKTFIVFIYFNNFFLSSRWHCLVDRNGKGTHWRFVNSACLRLSSQNDLGVGKTGVGKTLPSAVVGVLDKLYVFTIWKFKKNVNFLIRR